MTNETNRTKTKVSGIGKRGIAIVLCFVMLLTAIGSGSVLNAIAVEGNGASVLLDAAKAGADVDAPADAAAADDKADAAAEDEAPLTKKADSDLADTGRDADIAASAYYYENGARIFFDASAWYKGTDTFPTSIFFAYWKSGGDSTGTSNKMTRIANTSMYYVDTNSTNGASTTLGAEPSVRFFSSTSETWNNDVSYSNITTWQGSGCYVTGSYNEDIRSGYTYYYRASSKTAADPLYKDKEYSNTSNNLDTSGNIWKSIEKASVYTDYTTENTYAYAGDSNTDKGGKVKVGARYWSGWNSASSSLGYSNDPDGSSTYSQYDGAAKSAQVSMVVVSTFSGYTFQGWYNSSGTRLSTSTTYTFYTDGMNSAVNDIQARFKYNRVRTYYLNGYINGADITDTRYTFSGTSNPYTFALASTFSTQWITISDDTGKVYHPATHGAGSGTSYSTTNTDKRADPKWKVENCLNKNITFTWTGSSLSWTVSAGETVKVYAKDGAAPINWKAKTEGGATTTDGVSEDGKTKYYYNFGIIATTTANDGSAFTSVDCGISGVSNSGSKYQYKDVEKGKTISVTTTISETYKSKYYVRGWSVNGVTYSIGDNVKGVNTLANTSTGTYTMNFTIPAKTTVEKYEITPIYYLVNNTNCMTFYLENFESVKSTWGHTPYAYPYYGSLDGYQNSFGVYPGQPFVYADGKYSIEIPLTSKAISSTANDGTTVKGVTVNNGYADHVHRNLIYNWTTGTDVGDDNKHMQTYDYDDFYKIYKEKRDSQNNPPNAIFLRIKNEETYYNRDNYGSDNYTGQSPMTNWKFNGTGIPASTLSSSAVTTIAGNTRNGWELLTDRYGRPVDIFGNVIGTTYSAATEQSNPALRVISTGYNENIAGDYGTSWLVYRPSASSGYTTEVTNGGYTGSSGYTIVTDSTGKRSAIPPSIFLLNSTSSFSTATYPDALHSVDGFDNYTDSVNNYKAAYTYLKNNYSGRYVYITYEKNAQRYGKNNDSNANRTAYGAERCDARWYYTFATDMVRSKVKIQVYNTSTGEYQDVNFKTNSSGYNGKNNNAVASTVSDKSTENLKAYFTNANFDGDVDSGEVLINSGNFDLKATTVSGWKFKEWAIEQDGVYTHMNDSAVASTSMSASDTFVARFYPIDQGDLVITHDVTGTGSAKTEIDVKIYTDSTKTSLVEDLGTQEDIFTISDYISNDTLSLYIDVTLKTTPTGDDVFNNFGYDSFNTSKSITATENTTATPKTSNFGFTVGKLYSGESQITHSLAYTSSLTAATYNYKITYTYPKRGSSSNNDGSFTVSGTFTSNQYKQYVVDTSVAVASRKLKDTCITEKAPFESNYLKNMVLNASEATQQCSQSGTTITHTITATFSQSDDLDTYAIFDLPYEYYAPGDTIPDGSKIYTAKITDEKVVENHDTLPVEIDTTYNNYFTNGANNPAVVTKVTDVTDVNHTGNDFITAPEEIWDGNTKKYFMYWEVRNIVDNQLLLQIRYPDFNYRSYGNYHIEPIYSVNESKSWKLNYNDGGTTTSILYLDSTRNQWNSPDSTITTGNASTAANTAADLIYNDFLLSFYYKGQSIKDNASIKDCGMIIELVPTTKGGSTYALGDASTPGTSGYKTTYAASIPDKDTLVGVANGTVSGKYIRINEDSSGNSFKSQVNDKNRYEFSYSFYSQYGQANATGGNSEGYAFKTDSAVDNYVYRAYTYIKDSDDNVTISEPAYFSMKYTASR